MYELRLDRKFTKTMFSHWDKETKDWVVNAIASLVLVDLSCRRCSPSSSVRAFFSSFFFCRAPLPDHWVS